MSTQRPIALALDRLRRRAWAVRVARVALAASGVALSVLSAAAIALGPLASSWQVTFAWLAALAAAACASRWALSAEPALRGGAVAHLFDRAQPGLGSRARSAWELGQGDLRGASEGLRAAHAMATEAALAAVSPAQIVPWSDVRHRATDAALVAAALGVVALGLSPRGIGGAHALVHVGAHGLGDAPSAALFGEVRARIVEPAYAARAARTVDDPDVLAVLPGATVELSARSRVACDRAELTLGGRALPLERQDDGRWLVRFVAREAGALRLQATVEGGGLTEDAVVRTLLLGVDAAPVVRLVAPALDVTVRPDERVEIRAQATDDLGLGEVTLAVRGADGRERRTRLPDLATAALAHEASTTLSLAELGAAPGDRVTVWVEATDLDDVNGPKVGRSEVRTLTLASEATLREEGLAALEALVEEALARLADRLESPPPEDPTAATARFERSAEAERALVAGLSRFASELGERPGLRATDAPVVRALAQGVQRALAAERARHTPTLAPAARRLEADALVVRALEETALGLVDLLRRARADDAAAIARELEGLRREIASLLAELRRAETPEARAAVLAAIARAEQRLADLQARLGALNEQSPEEFANAAEGEAEETRAALERLREAVERGDLGAAAEALTALEQEIDALARAIGQTGEAGGEERFGARDRAIAEALDRLMGLEAEERELARRSGETRAAAARRAIEASGEAAARAGQALAGRIGTMHDALEPLREAGLATMEREALDATEARLDDARAALGQGDLGEASRMLEEATTALDGLSRDLDLDALMFPGHHGETAAAARASRDASRSLAGLRAALDEAMPDVRRHLSESERAQLGEDVTRQDGARGAAEELVERLAEGPNGPALSEEAAASLREVVEEMGRASDALRGADAIGASRAEDEAARRLGEIRRQLESDAQQGGDGGGSSRPSHDRPVDIPEADAFAGSMELRRRLLDAMREPPPSGWEGTVRRYYEGLLR